MLLALFCKNYQMHVESIALLDMWNTHWEYCRKVISLSISGIYYGYYKIQILFELLSFLRHILVNLAMRNSTLLER